MPHIFDLHFHSVHSDGNGWPREIAARARSVTPGVTLWDLMGVLRQHPRPDGTCLTVDDIWKHMGKRPRPQPSAEGLFRIYRDVAPAVILAHPHNYKLPPEKLAPHLARWRADFNLIGLECWHRGTFRPDCRSVQQV